MVIWRNYDGKSAANAIKIFINRNYYSSTDNKYRVKLTVSGNTVSGASGTSSVVGGLADTSSLRYKVLTTIATSGSEGNIKSGTAINSSWDIVNVGSSPVTQYALLEYDSAAISSFYPILNFSVQK